METNENQQSNGGGSKDCCSAMDRVDPVKLRAAARLAMAAGISALLMAPLTGYHLWLAGFAVSVTLLANGGLISFATSHSDNGLYAPMTSSGSPHRLDKGTCALGYAMVPITMVAVICLALYKADTDHNSAGRTEATKRAAVVFLRFVGCGGLAETDVALHRKDTALMLQSRFLGVALLAVLLFLAILGIRAVCTEEGAGSQEETDRTRMLRTATRGAFGVAVALVVFGAAGFQPLVFCWIACGLSLVSSVVMLSSVSEATSPNMGVDSWPTLRTQVQAHALNSVTLCCVYCLGCVVLEDIALDEGNGKWDIKVRVVGFQMAFTGAIWFAIILAARDIIKSKMR